MILALMSVTASLWANGGGYVRGVKFQKVYPGSKYQDTGISELTLVTPLEKAPQLNPAR